MCSRIDRAVAYRNRLGNNRAVQYGRALSGRTYLAVVAPDLQSAIFEYMDPPKYTFSEVYKLYGGLNYQSQWDNHYWVSSILVAVKLPEIVQRDISHSAWICKEGETPERAYWTRLLKAEMHGEPGPDYDYEVLRLCKKIYGRKFAALVRADALLTNDV